MPLTSRSEIEAAMLADWEQVLGRTGIKPYDHFHLLGGTPTHGAQLCRLLEQRYGGFVHPQLLVQRPTPRALATYFLSLQNPSAAPERKPPSQWRADRDRLLNAGSEPELAPLGSSLALILCAPRSGSTLLRVMLAGHPELFAPPELDLLLFGDMDERQRSTLGGWFDLRGLERTVMELWGVEAEEAARMVEQTCREGWTVQRVYGWLQSRAGDRLLIDKTPAYSLHRRCLERAEAWFRRPRYVHLVRHPLPVIRSWESFRLDHVMAGPPRETAEMMWLLCNETIMQFLDGVEPERHCRVFYEDLVRDPRGEMERVAATFGVVFNPAMLNPYEAGRMTDGVAGMVSGDRKFFDYAGIDASLADASRRRADDPELHPETVALAEQLGYADL